MDVHGARIARGGSDTVDSAMNAGSPHRLPQTHPLALFLGQEPRVVLGGLRGAPALAAVSSLANGSVGSMLVIAGADVPRDVRRLGQFLAQCHRVVRPGGRIAVLGGHWLPAAIEALRAAPTLRSGVEQLCQLANYMSVRAVMGRLQATGWENVELFVVSPSVENPAAIRPSQRGGGWRDAASLVVAGKDIDASPSSSVLQSMTESVLRACPEFPCGDRTALLNVANSGRGKSVAIASSGRGKFVLRIPRSAAMLEDETRSFAVLRRLESNADVKDRVPRPLAAGSVGGLCYFAQSYLPGSPLTTALDARSRGFYLGEVEAFLRSLNREFPGPAPIAVDSLCGAWVGQPMVPYVLQHIEDASLRARARTLIDDSLRGASGRHGIVHGDFGAGNILVQRDRLVGVIDWEAAHEDGLPLLDSFNYLDATHRQCSKGTDIVDTIPLLATGEWPVREEIEFLRRSFDHCGVDFSRRKGMAVLYFLFHIGPQLRFSASESGPKARLQRVLRRLLGA